jgi:hypothetical protein
MLTIHSEGTQRFCDGFSRRDFKVGTLGIGGLTLADLLRLKARGAVAAKRIAQGRHHGVPERRSEPHRYV